MASLQCAHASPCTYDFKCVVCCARLVASGRPSRKYQEIMFAAIERFRDAVPRQEILNVLNAK